MIVTVTPNPSVDRTISLPDLRRGAVQRATSNREDPGGKGVNVSRALALHGTPTTAVLPLGGHAGRLMRELLAESGVPIEDVPVAGSTRANVALVEPDGTTTKVNETGPVLTPEEVHALEAAVQRTARGAVWVVACGSLARGLADGWYARLVELVRPLGVRIAVDTSGAPLPPALRAAPALVKPNRVELADAVGRDLGTVGDVVTAARELVGSGIEQVVVSLGRDGALLVTAHEVVHGIATVEHPVSTVGAGDSLLAGFLHASVRGARPADALRTAIAFGSAAVALPGSQMPSRDDVAAVEVTTDEAPDPDMPLTD